MQTKYSNEAGFTLIELLIVTAIIIVLASLSVNNFKLYREKIYENRASNVMKELRTAIESGKIQLGVAQSALDWDSWAHAVQDGHAPLQGANANDLLRGYTHDSNMFISINHNGICDAGYWGDFCMVTSITTRHCKSDVTKNYWVLKNGNDFQGEWGGAVWPCS